MWPPLFLYSCFKQDPSLIDRAFRLRLLGLPRARYEGLTLLLLVPLPLASRSPRLGYTLLSHFTIGKPFPRLFYLLLGLPVIRPGILAYL